MDGTDSLIEIEAIKQLKARYCRLMDTKDWLAWRELFTDDFRSDTRPVSGKLTEGGDAFVAYVSGLLGRANLATVHQVHAAEIELTSATTAHGVWALEDLLRFFPGLTVRGFGHYDETYRKQDGQWRIATSTLTRLREDLQTPLLSVSMPSFVLRYRLRASLRKDSGR